MRFEIGDAVPAKRIADIRSGPPEVGEIVLVGDQTCGAVETIDGSMVVVRVIADHRRGA